MRHPLAILLLLAACAADAPPALEIDTVQADLAAMDDCLREQGITPPDNVEPFTIELPAPAAGEEPTGDVIFFTRTPADGDADRPVAATCFRQLVREP
jgi:hypothetical protein